MTITEAFISWFDRTLLKVFMTRNTPETFLNKDLMKLLNDTDVPKLMDILGHLISQLQNYQESLRESLEETQVDVETIDTDKDEMVVDQSAGTCVSMETENSPSVSGVTSVTGVTSVMSVTGVTSRTVTVQNASVQTDDDKHSGLISNCSRSKDQIGSSRFVNDEPTTSSCSVSHGGDSQESSSYKHVDENLVQIRASKSEIDRRIAAFVGQKQMEVNELNRREFCSVSATLEEAENGCARVDALFITRKHGRSHIKVSRVVNLQGPQMQIPVHGDSPIHRREQKNDVPQGIEERVRNMEQHTGINKGRPPFSDVYSRIKVLEERILFLEGLSPEYFTSSQPPHHKKPRKETRDTTFNIPDEGMSVSDIDLKIRQIKESLARKTSSSIPPLMSSAT